MTIEERAKEIERSIIDDAINQDGDKGTEAFKHFINSNQMNEDEMIELNLLVFAALSAPFSDRYKPLNALVCRAVEWQAERLARLE